MLELIPGIGAEPYRSWWSRNVVSDTPHEPERETDSAAGFFRMLAVCVLLSVPVWVGIALLLIGRFG